MYGLPADGGLVDAIGPSAGFLQAKQLPSRGHAIQNAKNAAQRGVGTSMSDGVQQRKEIIELLKGLKTEVASLEHAMTSGSIKVEVVNLPREGLKR